MPSFGPNHQWNFVQPLVDCFVYQFLVDLFPTARQHFFQVIEVPNLLLINKLLQCSPNAIVDRIAVWAVRWPVFGLDELRHVAVRKATVCLDKCAGAPSCWKMKLKWLPDSRRMLRSTSRPLPTCHREHVVTVVHFSTSINKHQWCLVMFR